MGLGSMAADMVHFWANRRRSWAAKLYANRSIAMFGKIIQFIALILIYADGWKDFNGSQI